MAAMVGVNVSNFLFHIVISRGLKPSGYGVISSVLNAVATIAVPAGALGVSVTKAVNSQHAKGLTPNITVLLKKVLLSSVVLMLVFDGSSRFVQHFLHLPSLVPLLIAGTWLPFVSVGAVLQGALFAELKYKSIAYSQLLGTGLLRLLLGALFIVLGLGISSVIFATVIGQAITTFMLLCYSKEYISEQHKTSETRTETKYYFLSMFSLLGFAVLNTIDVFLARHLLNSEQAGVYAAGSYAGHIALFAPGVIAMIAFPKFSASRETGDSDKKTIIESMFFTLIIGLLTTIIISLFSKITCSILFGNSYTSATQLFSTLCFTSVALGIINLFSFYFLAHRSIAALIPWAGTITSLLLILRSEHSPKEVASSMLTSCVFTCCLYVFAFLFKKDRNYTEVHNDVAS